MNPHDVTRQFEDDLCKYTGSPFAVATTSCTMALLLCCSWVYNIKKPVVPLFSIPRRTYIGVAMSILNARCDITFNDEDWQGQYLLRDVTEGTVSPPYIVDAARRFTKDMFKTALVPHGSPWLDMVAPSFQCVSFHASKVLTAGSHQGGAILHNDPNADSWLRRARFDGRTEGVHPRDDTFDMRGYHAYMSPADAAALRWALSVLPETNADLPPSDYSDLSLAPIFQR